MVWDASESGAADGDRKTLGLAGSDPGCQPLIFEKNDDVADHVRLDATKLTFTLRQFTRD
jgi:hypothetical protein